MAAGSFEARARRIATLPNGLTVARLAILGAALAALFAAHSRVVAVALLAAAGGTDFLDGYLARRFDQVSELGKVLDPSVDRAVIAASVVAITVYGASPPWLAGVVFGREAVVALAALALAARGAPRIDVLFVGKAGTFGLMCAFPLLLLGDAPGAAAHALAEAGWVLVWPALACSALAALAYVPRARRALVLARAGRPLGSAARNVRACSP
ncbi:MAG TPA: CDP-alcohol phosphatidyltransferase family protein [Acidimicrobiales bacterium]|nr:CDP-alcohol phosphatidyltransferase family protein [Acidimicrobiales bacterium]